MRKPLAGSLHLMQQSGKTVSETVTTRLFCRQSPAEDGKATPSLKRWRNAGLHPAQTWEWFIRINSDAGKLRPHATQTGPTGELAIGGIPGVRAWPNFCQLAMPSRHISVS